MKTFTPGPWVVSFESVDPEWAVVTGKGGHIVANVNSESGPDVPPLVSVKMPRDANARLIAASPDLLAACLAGAAYSDALARYQGSGKAGMTVQGDNLDALFEKWHDLTHAALAKIGGPQ